MRRVKDNARSRLTRNACLLPDFTQADQENQTAANFFDQNYHPYEFPTSGAGLSAANGANVVATSFPFHPHPHPQHPHLGVEALGHAAAASQHAGRVSVPGVTAPEGDGGNHVFNNANGADHSMDLTMTSGGGDTTNASDIADAQQDRSSGKAARSSLSVPGTDGSGSKKETPYSRSPDMRNSHKLAERKRRKEMKDLFDDLRDQLPVDRGPKTSKWEILCKAVEHITALRKERDDFAAELNALRGGGDQVMTEESVAPPPPAPEESAGADEYAKYEEQQVASQQQVEAAAAAANQFTAHHDYSQPGQEEHHQEQHHQEQQQHQQQEEQQNVQEADYKPEEQSTHEAIHEQAPTEQDWSAIAAQAAQAQAAQVQSAQ